MKRNLFCLFAVGFSLFLNAATVLAHHNAATVYDANKRVTLKGKVTKLEWMNPHVYYYVDVTDDNGTVVNWECESGPPNTLYRRGWRKDDLKAGDIITVENASVARNGSKKVSGGTVTLANGRKVFGGSAGDGLPQR